MNLFGRLSARYNYRFPFRAFILLHHVAHTDLGQIRLLILLGSNRYPFVQKVTCLLWLLIKMEGLCALILRDSLYHMEANHEGRELLNDRVYYLTLYILINILYFNVSFDKMKRFKFLPYACYHRLTGIFFQ